MDGQVRNDAMIFSSCHILSISGRSLSENLTTKLEIVFFLKWLTSHVLLFVLLAAQHKRCSCVNQTNMCVTELQVDFSNSCVMLFLFLGIPHYHSLQTSGPMLAQCSVFTQQGESELLRNTQDVMEGLCNSAGVGAPHDPWARGQGPLGGKEGWMLSFCVIGLECVVVNAVMDNFLQIKHSLSLKINHGSINGGLLQWVWSFIHWQERALHWLVPLHNDGKAFP